VQFLRFINRRFLINRYVALGAKYSLLITKDEVNNVIFYYEDGTSEIGKIAERLFIHYIAPNIFLKAGKSDGKLFFVFDGSMGCFVYRNYGTMVHDDFILKGAAFGISVNPGIDFKVTPNFALNIKLGLLLGTVNRMTMDYRGETLYLNDTKENISRFDLSIGFYWYKKKR